jgi:HSP20 family molecular chaperone IbpA
MDENISQEEKDLLKIKLRGKGYSKKEIDLHIKAMELTVKANHTLGYMNKDRQRFYKC